MGKIVVGIDGSETSQRALRWAVEEAQTRKATLTVVHAWTEPSAATGFGAARIDQAVPLGTARQVLETAIAGIGGADLASPLEAKLVGGGASDVILEEAERADLLVVGSRGRAGFAGLLLGLVSQQVVQHATCPVVVIPTAAP